MPLVGTLSSSGRTSDANAQGTSKRLCPKTAVTAVFITKVQNDWLPGQDSNLGQRLQRPLCCHYTTGQYIENARLACVGLQRPDSSTAGRINSCRGPLQVHALLQYTEFRAPAICQLALCMCHWPGIHGRTERNFAVLLLHSQRRRQNNRSLSRRQQ